ncbi:MAG: NADH-quinone oxidoreductase subunit L [Acidobacteriota bacterium]
MHDYVWLVLLFPLLGAAVNGFFGKRLPRPAVGLLSCSAVFLSFLVALGSFWEMSRLPLEERVITQPLFTWIESGGFVSEFALLLDPLALVMILIVTGVGFLIHVYSIGYMAGEDGYYRYFSYLNLFILMMSILVLADNYLVLFVGWEGVGLCSYLLIGYDLARKSAGDAAKKAFIVNRIGDVGFVLGIFLLFRTFGSVDYLRVFDQVSTWAPQAGGVLEAITLLLFIGAVGKSAQIPLYVWLPDAMEGPTPVSALIHAATMVTAGVYMIARSAALYSRAPGTLAVVAAVGLATALLAALIAMAQSDIKKVLAYSTVSQLGYMFLALGVGAFGAGIFHLMTHAFFKALLFLAAGSVILSLHHQQNMFKMGGLRRHLPVTYWTMMAAAAAITGIPGFSGFFSKDEILWEAFSSPRGGVILWLVGVAVAGLTAFYMFRLIFLTFHGQERFEPGAGLHPPHEPSPVVTLPLVGLAVFSIFSGYVGLPGWTGAAQRLQRFLEPSFRYQYSFEAAAGHSHLEEVLLMGVAIMVSGLGILLAYRCYLRDIGSPDRLARRFSGVYRLLEGKFFVDELYDRLLIRPLSRFSKDGLWGVVDVKVLDGAVNGTASGILGWGNFLKLIQSGQVRSYAAWILCGASLLLFYLS